jgi:hypothetical protein
VAESNADIARDSWIDEADVSRLASGEKHPPSRDALIRLGAFELNLSVEDLDEPNSPRQPRPMSTVDSAPVYRRRTVGITASATVI